MLSKSCKIYNLFKLLHFGRMDKNIERYKKREMRFIRKNYLICKSTINADPPRCPLSKLVSVSSDLTITWTSRVGYNNYSNVFHF